MFTVSKISILVGWTVWLYGAAGVAQPNLYADTGISCTETELTQHIWLNPEGFVKAGWSGQRVDQLEGTIIRAINVWNEEDNSQRNIVYGGRGSPVGRPPDPRDTFIQGIDGYRCDSNQIGNNLTSYGHIESASNLDGTCASAAALNIYLQYCPASGHASTHIPYTFYWPNSE